MARPKKADEQKQLAPAMQPHIPQAHAGPAAVPVAAAPPPVMNHANRSIDVPNFIRVRDSVSTDPPSPFSSTTRPPANNPPLSRGGQHQPPPPKTLKQGSLFDGDNAINIHHRQAHLTTPCQLTCLPALSLPPQLCPSIPGSLVNVTDIMSPSASRLYHYYPQTILNVPFSFPPFT